MHSDPVLSRRHFLEATTLVMLAPAAARSGAAPPVRAGAVAPFPLATIRLKPSLFLRAVMANLSYLHRLDPDRLLHNYRAQAGLAPRGESYGGWERESIAGHTIGHYLSACLLMHAQTGDAD